MTIDRLRSYDQHCLRVETPQRPVHIGILATLDDAPLRDGQGRLRLEEIRREIDARTAGVPALRRVVHRPGFLGGGPIWLHDAAFRIDHHVGYAALPDGRDPAAPMTVVEALLAEPLDRSRPLWRMWLIDESAGGRLWLLFVIHHALADGMTAMRLARSLLEAPLGATRAMPARSASQAAPPTAIALVVDNALAGLGVLRALGRPSTWRRARDVLRAVRSVADMSRVSRPCSLNAPVGPRRRTETIRLEATRVKRLARAHQCGVNDVLLALVAGGIRALLEVRGEPVHALRPRAGIAVALPARGRDLEAGNDIGSVLVSLPLGEADPVARLQAIARERNQARQSPMVALEPLVRAALGRLPAYRRSLERQRLVNLAVTYLPGPSLPITVLGARAVDLVPLAPLAGNLGLSFVALSYAGTIGITIRADADRFPDLAALRTGVERDWERLCEIGASRTGTRQADADGPRASSVVTVSGAAS